MTAFSDRFVAYHIGLVVDDLDATSRRYDDLLGPLHWRDWQVTVPATPWLPETSDARLRLAFGRVSGLTIELIQVLEGETIHSLFLKRRGEGVQHIGLWVPDLEAAVREAIAKGARITFAVPRQDGATAVQLTPASGQAAILGAMSPAWGSAYLDGDLAGVQLELMGPAGHVRMQRTVGEGFDSLVVSPPWV